jgi:regulator of sigma E protease
LSDLLLFIVVLSVLILGHEFGHFLASKLSGVRVEEFGVGFPPRLLTLFERGGTKYTLNLIPFGGFVRPAGEDDPDVEGGLANSSKKVRTFVLLAGPIINILFGFLAFFLAFKLAAPDLKQVLITGLVDGAPAQQAGIQIGDVVRRVEGQSIDGFDSMVEVVQANIGTTVLIEVERDDVLLGYDLIPRTEFPSDQGPIGVSLGHPAMETSWVEAAEYGTESVVLQIQALISLPGRLLRGTIQPEAARVSGLKGIHDLLAWANEIDRNAQRPFLTMNMIGVISIGLAIANLLPFPALDGGRLMFILIEVVFRRRLSPRYEGLVHAIGFAVLLALMVYFNLQDFINPISLPR